MTTKTLNLSKDIETLSDSDMLAIAYDLNSIEPGAGSLGMFQNASFADLISLDPLSITLLSILLVSIAIVALPSLKHFLRKDMSPKK